MYSAVLFLNSEHAKSLADSIIEKNTIYLPISKYFLCLATTENIPISLRKEMQPVVVQTDFQEPIRAYQRYHSSTDQLFDPKMSRKLMAIRSKLVYSIYENLAPDNFYFQLEEPANETQTRRRYQYRLYYQDIPCYVYTGQPNNLKEPPVTLTISLFQLTNPIVQQAVEYNIIPESDLLESTLQSPVETSVPAPDVEQNHLLDHFNAAIQQTIGPLLLSTYSLNNLAAPNWYILEMFRDLVELGELEMDDKVLVEGPTTGQLYLFYQKESNLTEDIVSQIVNDVRGRLVTSIRLRIFPRNTPNQIIKSRQLVNTRDKQWILPYPVPKNIDVFNLTLKQSFMLKSVDDLFWFLTLLLLCNTYSFIEKELEIFVDINQIRVCHETCYLPDFLRVRTASRARSNGNSIQIYYPQLMLDSIDPYLVNKTYIHFYDQTNNQKAVLVSDEIDLPKISRTYPLDFSLDTRINYDGDLTV